jgi:hypothetical protein
MVEGLLVWFYLLEFICVIRQLLFYLHKHMDLQSKNKYLKKKPLWIVNLIN